MAKKTSTPPLRRSPRFHSSNPNPKSSPNPYSSPSPDPSGNRYVLKLSTSTMKPRMSPRLALVDTTNVSSCTQVENVGKKKNRVSSNASVAIHGSNSSSVKRKSPRLAAIGRKNSESCLENQRNQLISKKDSLVKRKKSKRIKKVIEIDSDSSEEESERNRLRVKKRNIMEIMQIEGPIENKKNKITKKDKKSEDSDPDSSEEDKLRARKKNKKEMVQMEAPVECSNGKDVGFDGWSEEQEMALQRAYFTVKPSPHFWKRVSKMVPGKNDEECFNKIHSSFKTPPSILPKSKLNKPNPNLSPLHKFDLLENPKPKARRVSKQKKTLDARKTVRTILKKHQNEDKIEGDYFSQFEHSPIQLPSDFKFPDSCPSTCKTLSKLNPNRNPNPNDPSPAVLKPIKNMALHEKYIDHLHCVDAKRRACVIRFCDNNNNNNKGKNVNLKEVKVSLESEAQDFIGRFKLSQSDPFGDFIRSDEDDDY